MRPMVLTKTGTGASNIGVLDHYRSPFNVGVGVVVSGTATYTLQHTFDDILAEGVTPVWFDHVDLDGLSANADGNYAFPVRAVRINVTAGSGTVTATVIQAGMPGL
jgi:hypothetical protein